MNELADIILYTPERPRLIEPVPKIMGKEKTFGTWNIYYLDHEWVGYSPYTGEMDIEWSGDLKSAVLHVKIEPAGWRGEKCSLEKISLNDKQVWSGKTHDEVKVDVTGYMIRGLNKLRLDYDTSFAICNPFTGCTHATAYITITDSSVAIKKPEKTPYWAGFVVPIAALGGVIAVSTYVVGRAMKSE